MGEETGVAESSLTVDRIRATYRVAADHPRPRRVQERLDGASHKLAEAVASLLGPLVEDSDESVWFVRHLHAEAEVDAAWNEARLGRQWAAALCRSLLGALSSGPDGGNVLRFDDRAHYLACFVRDMVRGRARSAWYYERFSGLLALPVSAAVRTALLADRGVGLRALLRLEKAELWEVVAQLSESDSRRVARELVASSGAAATPPLCLRALAESSALEEVSLDPAEPERRTLALSLEVLRSHPGLLGEALVSVVRACVELRRRISTDPDARRRELASLSWGEPTTALSASRAELAPLVGLEPELLLKAVAPRENAALGEADAGAGTPLQRRSTEHGGLFLLLPELARTLSSTGERDENAWAASEARRAAVLRLLVAAKCWAGDRAAAVFDDSLIRDLLGVTPAFVRSDLAAWATEADVQAWARRAADSRIGRASEAGDGSRSEELSRDLDAIDAQLPSAVADEIDRAARAVLSAFSRHLTGFADSSPEFLLANFLDFRASLEEESGRRVVRLGRPPLYLVLNRTSLARATYVVPWLDERPFCLFPEE